MPFSVPTVDCLTTIDGATTVDDGRCFVGDGTSLCRKSNECLSSMTLGTFFVDFFVLPAGDDDDACFSPFFRSSIGTFSAGTDGRCRWLTTGGFALSVVFDRLRLLLLLLADIDDD